MVAIAVSPAMAPKIWRCRTVVRYAKFHLTVLYTKISIATSKDRSHKDTVAHIDIKIEEIN